MKKLSRIALVLGFVAVGSLSVTAGVASAARHNMGTPYYLALGDSVAAGYQTPSIDTDRACASTSLDAQGQRGFTCPLWTALQSKIPGLQFQSLALASSPGTDSCSFIGPGGTISNSNPIASCFGQHPLTDAGPGDTAPYDINNVTQLQAAESFIASNNVKVISLNLGGNDFLPLLAIAQMSSCPPYPNCVAYSQSLIPTVESRLATNLTTVVGTLRTIDPTATFLIGDQYNPLSGLPASALGANGAAILSLAASALASFQTGVKQLAAGTGSQWVNELGPFNGKGPVLTWITSSQDIHPNNKGYLLLEKAFFAGYLDATSPMSLKVKITKKVNPGKKQVFKITTLPNSSVTTTITYTVEGWKTTATRSGTADLNGALVQKWLVPAHATSPSANTCSSVNGKSKCQTSKFIIA
jgi:lysophospholipase L1-like esterase